MDTRVKPAVSQGDRRRRLRPYGFVLLAVMLVAIGSFWAGLEWSGKPQTTTAAKQHCPAISLSQVHTITGHPDLTELTNGTACAFNSGPWALFGIQLQNDKDGKFYEQNYGASNGGTVKVPGTKRAFWGAKQDSIFFWKDGKFGAIIGGPYVTSEQFVSLASAAALKI